MEKPWLNKDGLFVRLNAEQISKLSDEQAVEYQTALTNHAIKMEQEASEMKGKIKDLEEKSDKNDDEIEQLKVLKEKFDEINPDAIKNLTEAVKQQGLILAKLQGKGGKKTTEKTDLMKFIEREELKDDMENRRQVMKHVVLKVPALMTTANVIPNVANGFNQLFGNFIDDQIHETPKPDNFILPLITVITAPGTENIWYVERENEEGDAAFIGEGDLKPLTDGEWVEKKAEIKEVAVRWKMSNRLMMHAPSVVQNFREHADELVDQVIDDGVATGDGVGDNLNGVTTLAAPFVVPPALANFYPDANIFDAIMAVATYVRLNNFKGELTCVLNTVYMAQMLGIKASDFQYITPKFVTPDGRQVGEVRIIFTNKIPDTDIILGDLRKFKAVIAEDVRYFQGWENDDFSKNLTSHKLEAFLGTYLPDSDAGAIIYDQIATILTAIDLP